MGYDTLCSFTQQSRAVKLPEILGKIILIHPQKSCPFGQRNTARWERQRRRWDAEKRGPEWRKCNWDGSRKGMKDISSSVLKCSCFLSSVEVLYLHFSQSSTASRLRRKALRVFPWTCQLKSPVRSLLPFQNVEYIRDNLIIPATCKDVFSANKRLSIFTLLSRTNVKFLIIRHLFQALNYVLLFKSSASFPFLCKTHILLWNILLPIPIKVRASNYH